MLEILSLIFILIFFTIAIYTKPGLTPGKMIYMVFALTSLSVFTDEYSDTTLTIALIIHAILISYIIIESLNFATCAPKKISTISQPELKTIVLICWIMGAPSIAILLSMIIESGGIFSYFSSLSYRVIAWRGEGLKIATLKSFAVFNLIYFCAIALSTQKKTTSWFLFFAHFTIFLFIGISSGSRNTLLLNIVLMIFIFQITNRHISKPKLLALVLVVASLLLSLGTLRDSAKFTEDGVNITSSDSSGIKNQTLSYSIKPIEIIIQQTPVDLELGKTYLSLVTNFIPRALWEEKWKTSGIVFTERYLGNLWDGSSYMSPGFIAEGIMNFGYAFGVIFAFILLIANLALLYYLHKRIEKTKNITLRSLIAIIAFMYYCFSVSNLFFAEFTTNYFNLSLRLIPLFLLYVVVKIFTIKAPRHQEK